MNIKSSFKYFSISVVNTNVFQKYLSKRTDHLATIFMLHRMDMGMARYGGHSPEFLEDALKYLRDNGYHFVSVEDLLLRARNGAEPIKKAVAFTMDDGYMDQARVALPIFVKFKCPITVFLITGFIDNKSIPWDTIIKFCFYETKKNTLQLAIDGKQLLYNLSNNTNRMASMRDFRDRCKSLNEDELSHAIHSLSELTDVDIRHNADEYILPLLWNDARKSELNSEVSFGVHTVRHLILSNLSGQRAEEEICNSWDNISTKLIKPVKIFAYPIGRYDDFLLRDIDIIKQNNYLGAVTAEPGYFDQGEVVTNEYSRYMIKRFSFPDNIQDLIQLCSGIEFIKHKLRNNYFFSFWNNKRYLFHSLIYKIYSFLGLYSKYKKIDWKRINRLVFVCKGNICRSPYAEYKSLELGLNTISVGVDTDGISGADEMAMKISAIRGIDISTHISRKANKISYSESDLLVCMEPWHAKDILNNQDIENTNYQVTVLGLWCTNKIALIRDPYGQSTEMFIKCFDLIDDSLSNIKLLLE
jgi:protein-tyrosine-phosphatase/peptidoglycan/xylan/chitin deacetylase (PgdA/CDA1 family)